MPIMVFYFFVYLTIYVADLCTAIYRIYLSNEFRFSEIYQSVNYIGSRAK